MANDAALEMRSLDQTVGGEAEFDSGLHYTGDNEPNRSENGKIVLYASAFLFNWYVFCKKTS